MEVLFWIWLIVATTLLFIDGIFREYPMEVMMQAVLWPATLIVLIGCAFRDLFDWTYGKIND